jgi:hypothetical protein
LTAVSAFQRRASAHLLQRPGAGTMSLANLSRIESLSGQRQGCPFGCPGPLDEIDRLLPCCNARNVEKVGLEGTFQPDSFYRIRRFLAWISWQVVR